MAKVFILLPEGDEIECKFHQESETNFIVIDDFECNVLDLFEGKLDQNDALNRLTFLLNSSDNFHYQGDDFELKYYPDTYSIYVDSENFDEPSMILSVNAHNDTVRKLELQNGWNAGEPVNDPCDDTFDYLLNRGGITQTLFILLNFDFEEINS